jgi:hypothetical protein
MFFGVFGGPIPYFITLKHVNKGEEEFAGLWSSGMIELAEIFFIEQNITGIFIHVSICSVVNVGSIIATTLYQQA